MIRTEKLSNEFNGFRALSAVDLSVAGGTLHAWVGPHGAGNTRLFNLLTSSLRRSFGTVIKGGQAVTGDRPEHSTGVTLKRARSPETRA